MTKIKNLHTIKNAAKATIRTVELLHDTLRFKVFLENQTPGKLTKGYAVVEVHGRVYVKYCVDMWFPCEDVQRIASWTQRNQYICLPYHVYYSLKNAKLSNLKYDEINDPVTAVLSTIKDEEKLALIKNELHKDSLPTPWRYRK